jgi:hypothetical protein
MKSESDSGSSPDSRWRTIRSPKQTLSTGGAACFIAGMSQTERYAAEWIAEMGLAFEAVPAAPESLVDLPRPGLPQTQLFALLSYREACRLGREALSANGLARPTAPAAQYWVKVKNPKAPAARREAEEDWGSSHWIRSKTPRLGR